jgi:MFS family permease
MLNALDFAPDIRRTFAYHRAYSALSGVVAGMLSNGPTIGIKALRATDWHLALPTGLSGIGLFLTLALGVWMARRPKLPFVLVPGFASCAACLGMATAPDPLVFLFLLGLFNLLDSTSRPAIAVIIRLNYPAESRGWVTGRLRRWSAGTFLLAGLATAWVLDRAGTWPVIQTAMATAAALQALAYLAFSRIRVRPETRGEADADAFAGDARSALVDALAAVKRDPRFLRYLWGSVIFQLGNLMYETIVRAFLSSELHFNYTQCVFIADVLPSTFSLLTTPRLGAWLDRTNPLIAWSLIRLGWGLDPLLLALSPIWPAGAMAIAATARLIRGGVMNGSYILWWELAGNYFATRRELTSVYAGASFSVNGVQRMIGPPLGAYLGSALSRRAVLVIGGLMVLFAAYLARRQAEDEKVDGHYPTFADKESEPDIPPSLVQDRDCRPPSGSVRRHPTEFNTTAASDGDPRA